VHHAAWSYLVVAEINVFGVRQVQKRHADEFAQSIVGQVHVTQAGTRERADVQPDYVIVGEVDENQLFQTLDHVSW